MQYEGQRFSYTEKVLDDKAVKQGVELHGNLGITNITKDSELLARGNEKVDSLNLGEYRDKKIVDFIQEKAVRWKSKEQQKRVEQAFKETYGKEYKVNWKLYMKGNKKNRGYTEKINYYYLQALNLVTDENIDNFNFVKVLEKESVFHNFKGNKVKILGELNEKKVDYETGREVVVDRKEKVVKDVANIGTFNYYTYGEKDGIFMYIDKNLHGVDIINWIKYGSGINDISSIEERIEKFIVGGIVSMNYRNIQKWAKNKKYKYIGFDELTEYYGKENFDFLVKSIKDIINIK